MLNTLLFGREDERLRDMWVGAVFHTQQMQTTGDNANPTFIVEKQGVTRGLIQDEDSSC